MRLPVTMGQVSEQSRSLTQEKAKQLILNATNMASEYLQNAKSSAGGQAGVSMKTMNREKQDLSALVDYYNSQGQVAPAISTDPSGDIRKLSEMYAATSDPGLRSQYHQRALELAQGAGWLKPGEAVDSVSSLPQMTATGTENIDSYQQAIDNYLAQQKVNKVGSSGGKSSGPTDKEVSQSKVNDYIVSTVESRKTPKDASAQLQRDMSMFTSDEVIKIQDYIDKWEKAVNAGTREYGRYYTPKQSPTSPNIYSTGLSALNNI